MTLFQAPKSWLPYLVAALGTLLSLLLSYIFSKDLQAYFVLLITLKDYLPWLALLFGVTFTLLIAALIRVAQLAKARAESMIEMNVNLKKEIAERISAEETKQKLEVALLQGQKLQSIGTLAGGIAHDFNNILYAIIGYVQMARDDVAKDTLIYQNLGKVLEGTQRGQELISRILAFSRRQHHEFEDLHIKTTVEAALSLLRPTIPASVNVQFETDRDPVILGNQTQLHQVLVNIINNAVDAMEGEGTIQIKMSEIAAGDTYLKQFPDATSGPYCKIRISDTGHGMDQATMERIFEPFFTTKEVGKGTGLGMSIVHSIMKEHRGEIVLTSQLGQGTVFELLLPEVAA